MAKTISWLLMTYFILVPIAFGSAQKKRLVYEGNVHPLRKRFALEPGQQLTVMVRNIGQKGVVCVESKDPSQAAKGGDPNEVELRACALLYDENDEGMFASVKVKETAPLTDADVYLSDSTLIIDGHGSPGRTPLVHISMPAGRMMTVYVGGNLFRSGPISKGMMVQNGKAVVSQYGYPFHIALMQAIGVVPTTHPDAIQHNPYTGTYTLPWETLRALTQHVVTPVYSAASDGNVHPNLRGWAVLRVKVDQNGLVSEATYGAGDRNLAQAAIEAVRLWEFKPFSVDGKPVVIEGIIPLILKDGKVVFASDGM